MKLNQKTYRDRVLACWIGKNIGGTMGAPYEGTHEMLDIKGFATKPGEVLPNDDLDLQLVWLRAVEKTGPWGLDCKRLGEFWLSYIVAYWNEYGIGKMNMRRGLLPPLAGDYANDWRDSNGAWIRTEIWATLAPGLPDVAAKYAIEDAKVDHGAGEGTYAAAFVAAMQSAAFVVHDIRKIIEIGLARIPENCRLALSIREAIRCYEEKIPPLEAREKIRLMNADIGTGWFEAPSNVAYTVLGLLYGEGDFKKSMITAINCGDDTDCTAATVGATLGILGGTAAIPTDWREYIGDTIVTLSLNRAVGMKFPETCTELTDDVVALSPIMLFANRDTTKIDRVQIADGDDSPEIDRMEIADADDYPEDIADHYLKSTATREALKALKPYSYSIKFANVEATATFEREPNIRPGESIQLCVSFINDSRIYGRARHNLDMEWVLPEGFTVSGPLAASIAYRNKHGLLPVEANFTITAGETVAPENQLLLIIREQGYPTCGYLPVTLIRK
ncbi:MAG: ADP-ribosylglycohydrolase family protein [Clostridia bacterium]|nr:ADP-ribosylglycohydrolase family protein [Clostridia bacterium]